MNALYAACRLLWRPAILMLLFPSGLVIGLAFWEVTDSASGLAEARRTLWRFATIAPAAFALLVSLFMRELQHTLFAWTLPNLSNKLRLGKAVFGGLIAAGVAAVSLRLSDPGLSVAVFGWSWLSFAAGGLIFDPVLSKIESRGVALIFAALAFEPIHVERVMEPQPYLMGVAAAVTGVLLLCREFGKSFSRKRPVTFMPSAWANNPAGARQFWARQNASNAQWNRSLFRGGTGNWLLASVHEAHGAQRGGYAMALLIQLTVIVVYCHFLGNLSMAVIFPWIFVGSSALHLSTKLFYPLARSERAKLFFSTSLAETLAVSGTTVAALAIIFTIGVRPGVDTDSRTMADMLGLLAYFVALSPIGQWAKTRGNYMERASSSAKSALRYLAFQMAFVVIAMGVHYTARELAPEATLWIAGALFLVAHGTFWLALQRYFATRDLVLAPA